MIIKTFHSALLLTSLLTVAASGQNSNSLVLHEEIKQSIRTHSEGAVLEESRAVAEAKTKAQNRSEYGLELRPQWSDRERAGMDLRIYLPDRWTKSLLREQLTLAAESEELRVASLEWKDLMQVYRRFCDYRRLRQQLTLYDQERQTLSPYLEKANLSVQMNQLAVVDRAKLYSLYLDLINNSEQIKSSLMDIDQELRLLLGADADLEQIAQAAVLEMPSRLKLDTLMQRALNNRADYRWYDVQSRALRAATTAARSKDGFRLKYIQPSYEVDYATGLASWGIAAAFALPWGNRNPDVAVYQKERLLSLAAMTQKRLAIQNRLHILIQRAERFCAQSEERDKALNPLMDQLTQDLEQMNTGRLEDLRDLVQIRERVLEGFLQSAETRYQKEKIAVDLIEELGAIVE